MKRPFPAINSISNRHECNNKDVRLSSTKSPCASMERSCIQLLRSNWIRSLLEMFPVAMKSSFSGSPRRKKLSTKSLSLVTTTRDSSRATSKIALSVVRFLAGRSSVWTHHFPEPRSQLPACAATGHPQQTSYYHRLDALGPHQPCRPGGCGQQVGLLEIFIVRQNLCVRHPAAQPLQHRLNRVSQPADTWLPMADFGVGSDPQKQVSLTHGEAIPHEPFQCNPMP